MNLFSLTGTPIKTLFNTVPPIKGTQGTALASIGSNFESTVTVMREGSVSDEYGQIAVQKLYEAKLACEAAVIHGWQNGKSAAQY